MEDRKPEELLEVAIRAMDGLGPDNVDLDRTAIDCASSAADAGHQPAVDFILGSLTPYLVRKYLAIYRLPGRAEAPAVKLMRMHIVEQIDILTFKGSLREDLSLTYDIANVLSGFAFLLRGKKWTERLKQQSQ